MSDTATGMSQFEIRLREVLMKISAQLSQNESPSRRQKWALSWSKHDDVDIFTSIKLGGKRSAKKVRIDQDIPDKFHAFVYDNLYKQPIKKHVKWADSITDQAKEIPTRASDARNSIVIAKQGKLPVRKHVKPTHRAAPAVLETFVLKRNADFDALLSKQFFSQHGRHRVPLRAFLRDRNGYRPPTHFSAHEIEKATTEKMLKILSRQPGQHERKK